MAARRFLRPGSSVLRSEAGYSLLVVMGLALVVSMSTLFIVSRITSTLPVRARLATKLQLAPKTEAAGDMIIQLVQGYFKDRNPLDQLDAYLQANAASVMPSGTTLKSIVTAISPMRGYSQIRTGGFKGLYAQETQIRITVNVQDTAQPSVIDTLEISATYDGISFLQFTQFYFDDAWLWADNGLGRVHVNGKVCLGFPVGWVKAIFTSLTSADRFLDPDGPDCYGGSWAGRGLPLSLFAKMSDGTEKPVDFSAVHGCTNCAGTGMDWKDYAVATYEGRLKDSAHDVPRLDILDKTILTDATTQYDAQKTWGWDGTLTGKVLYDNQRREKLILDPVFTTDSDSAKQVKFAYNADIRVINGVWYLKDPSNANNWPGIPVWSDHPDRFTTDDSYEFGVLGGKTLNVGQKDIETYWKNYIAPDGTRPYDWGPQQPRHYSFYRMNGGKLSPDTWAVISYGTLKREAAGKWRPGFLLSNAAAGAIKYADRVCRATHGPPATCANCGSANEMRLAVDLSPGVPDPARVVCSDGTSPSVGAQLLFGARSGYVNGEWQELDYAVSPAGAGGNRTRERRSKILPMNFDFDAFQKAMVCDPSGHKAEIGCFFGAGRFMNRPFNGVIYVVNTWEGWRNNPLDHYTQDPCPTPNGICRMPPYPPFQSEISDSDQQDPSHPGQQTALPFQLCSKKGGGAAGDPYDDTNSNKARFVVADCKDYVSTKAHPVSAYKPAHPGAIRVVNAANVSTAVFPHGISLVSPITVATAGSVNSSSDTSGARSQPWVAMLIGADNSHNLSDNWRDELAPWNLRAEDPSVANLRIGSNLTMNFALIGSGNGFYLEDYRGKNIVYHRSYVMTHSTVLSYTGGSYPEGPATGYIPASRPVIWDPHYKYIENMPPGVPLINFFNLQSWKWRARQ